MPFADHGLTAVVELEEGSVEVSSWFDIWASLSAIATLCLDGGVAGVARVGEFTFIDYFEDNKELIKICQGENDRISVTLQAFHVQ